MKTVPVLVIAIALTTSTALGQQPGESADQQLKAAMQRELVGGDLRAAIKEYEAIVGRHRDNRAVAARALLQIGLCYDKLGQPDARKVYEQVVRDYADQSEQAAQARARLAALAPTRTTAGVGDVRPLDGLGSRALQSISPDGTRAVVVDYEKGPNLAVFDFGTRQMIRLTNFEKATSEVSRGVWSRDGRRIAFSQGNYTDSTYEVRIATLAGEIRTVFRNEGNAGGYVVPADWLPDGRTLLATLQRADTTWAIGFIPAAGGPFMPLRSLQWTGGLPDRPRVSPDGRFIAFADGAAGARDIHLLSLDGRTATRVTDHPADDRGPVWSPDGRHLAFLSARDGNAALWLVAIKDGKPVGDPIRVKEGLQGVNPIDWTPRGLVYVRSLRTSDIFTVPVEATTRQPAGEPQQLPYASTGSNTVPAWSPNGRHLAFVSGSAGEPSRRFVVVLPDKGGEPREFLIPSTRYSAVYDLRWFGDGSGLGFSGIDAQGQPTLFRLSLPSGEWKTTPAPVERVLRVEWDHIGKHIFYVRGLDLVERDLDSGQERVITDSKAVFAEAARARAGGSSNAITAFRGLRLSPDRRSLVLTSSTLDGDHTAGLWVVDLQSGAPRLLLWERSAVSSNAIVTFGSPAWSHDGRAVLVPRVSGATRWPDLRLVSVEDGQFRSIGLDKSFVRAAMGPDDVGTLVENPVFSPDGTRLAFVLTATRRTEAWIMDAVVATAESSRRVAR